MTNEEFFKSMTTRELAEYILEETIPYCPSICPERNKSDCYKKDCVDILCEWLKQEKEEEE